MLANVWMHCGPLMVDSDKMSKSLGNFRTIRQTIALDDAPADQAGYRVNPREAEMVRFFIVRNHYRSPQNYTPDNLVDAQNALDRLYQALQNVPPTARAWTGTSRRPRHSRPRWTTISTARAPSRRCSSWPPGQPDQERPQRRPAESAGRLGPAAAGTGRLFPVAHPLFGRGHGAGGRPALDAEAIQARIDARAAAKAARATKPTVSAPSCAMPESNSTTSPAA